jgi:DNA-directed RNA polymerase beta' subunit
MNMHVPQSIQTATELRYLASVARHIISPSTNGPIIQPAQDTLLGMFKLTDDSTYFTQNEIMNLMASVEAFKGFLPEPIIKDGKKVLWSGKQIYSMVLPPISLTFNQSSPIKTVIIEKGIMTQGQVEKKCSAKIVHIIFNDYGYVEAARYLNDLQKVVSRFMIRSGFSVGVSDLLVHPEIRTRNQESVKKAKTEVMKLTREVHLNALEDAITKDLITIYEGKVSGIANKVSDEVQKQILKTLDLTNRVNYIVKSGAKGDGINIQQMTCLLGQQIIDGKKVPLGFTDRSLPHYPRYENGMESRGFITSNFLEGLSPQEFFFHAMSGREGMIDTAVKTANSGYLQRKLVKATEDLKVAHDSTVRSSINDIIEFCYGEDGFNSTSLEMQVSNFTLITSENKKKYFHLDFNDKWEEFMTTNAVKQMKKIPNWKDVLEKYNNTVNLCIEIIHEKYLKYVSKIDDFKIAYPVEFRRLIDNTIIKFDVNKGLKTDLSPVDVINALEMLVKTCKNGNHENNSLRILAYDYLSPKKILKEQRITKQAFDYIIQSIKAKFMTSVAEGGEMVGPLAATSIGEITTQMTLNSVSWDTELLLKINNEIKIVKIGEFIDNYLKKSYKVEDHPNDTKLGWVNEQDIIYVPSVDEDGNCDWQKVEAVTRHPVINEDGSNTVLHVITDDGREVVATKAKSFLKVNKDNKIVGCNGSDLKVGDMIPVNQKAYEMPALEFLDMSRILSKKEYCFGTEMNKAWSYKDEHHWWMIHNEKDFIVPYKRSDSFLDGFRATKSRKLKPDATNLQSFEIGILYPKKQKENKARIPEKIPFDFDFGYLIGAYLAEGCTTITQISIANNDTKFFEPINRLMTKWNVRTKFYVQKDKCGAGWTSSDLRIYSKLLTDIISKLCGNGSDKKFIHHELFNGSKEFMKGLLSGYIGGDGSVNKKTIHISAHSVSYKLLEDIQKVLSFWFGIYSKIMNRKTQLTNNRSSKNILPAWEINLNTDDSILFAKEIPMYIDYKQVRLDFYKTYASKRTKNMIPYYDSNGTYIIADKNAVNPDLFKDVKFVSVKTITEIPYNSFKYMYDLTVDKTRNFIIGNSVHLSDTFHLAGVGEKSSVTAGVPRLHELLSNTKNPKNPSCRIYLTPEIRHDKEKCNKIRNNLELTTIKHILQSSAIYLEPNNEPTNILAEDRDIMAIYKIFSEINPQASQIPNNPWVIRLEFDHRKVLEQRIDMADIHHILSTNIPDAFLMYHDNNASKLVFRIRMNIDTKNTEDDIIFLKSKITQIESIVIKGVDEITKVWSPYESSIFLRNGDTYSEKKEFYLETDGSNLFDLLIQDGVDATRTYSVDPNDMLSVFGIEAARFTIENQLRILLESNSAKTSQRHLSLLCNKMCQRGSIMQVDRHGINRENIGPLAKCSFEETSVQLQEASLFGVSDDIKGVSSNIMVGQIPTCGTGETEILLDEDMLTAIPEVEQPLIEGPKFDEFMKVDPVCSAVSNIKFSLSNIQGDNIDFDALPSFSL